MKRSEPKLKFLSQNDDLFVLNKPAGIHSVGAGASIQLILEAEFPAQKNLPDAGIVHRLDLETSGCLLVARNEASYERLREAIRGEGQIHKIYWAVSRAKPNSLSFDFYFFSRYRGSKKVSLRKSGKPKERGRGRIKILRFVDGIYLLEIELVGPGKRHQIRAALSELSAPLLGDSLYGGQPWRGGIALHAKSLKNHTFSAVAPLPETWTTHLPVGGADYSRRMSE